jgi:hypothetical protein
MLFEVENDLDLAACITTLLENPTLYSKIATNSIKLIEMKYSEETFVRSFKSFLERFA